MRGDGEATIEQTQVLNHIWPPDHLQTHKALLQDCYCGFRVIINEMRVHFYLCSGHIFAPLISTNWIFCMLHERLLIENNMRELELFLPQTKVLWSKGRMQKADEDTWMISVSASQSLCVFLFIVTWFVKDIFYFFW